MSLPLHPAATVAERNLRARLQFAGRHIHVASQDVFDVLAALDRERQRSAQFQAAAISAIDVPVVAPLTKAAGR